MDAINGGPLTLEFDQSVFSKEDGVEKVGVLVKSYINRGGHQLQLNIINREKLLDIPLDNTTRQVSRIGFMNNYFFVFYISLFFILLHKIEK